MHIILIGAASGAPAFSAYSAFSKPHCLQDPPDDRCAAPSPPQQQSAAQLFFLLPQQQANLLSLPGGERRATANGFYWRQLHHHCRGEWRVSPTRPPSSPAVPSAPGHPPDNRCAAPLQPHQHLGCLYQPAGLIRPSKTKSFRKQAISNT